MSAHSSQESEESNLVLKEKDSKHSGLSKTMSTVKKYLESTGLTYLSMETSKQWLSDHYLLLTSLQGGILVNPGARQENALASRMRDGYGMTFTKPFAYYDQNTSSWRMFQKSLISEDLALYSKTLPKSGMMLNGKLYQRPQLERHTRENASSRWRTPTGKELRITKGELRPAGQVQWTTPCASETGYRKKKYSQGGTALSTQLSG